MSNYRDDVNETAVVSDQLLTRLRDIGESTAFASDTIIERLRVLYQDTAVASDEALGSVVALLQDTIAISDEVLSTRIVRVTLSETARARDFPLHRITAPTIEEAATASVSTMHLTRALLVDSARASDSAQDARTKRQLVVEAGKANDSIWNRIKAPLLDATAVASDGTEHRTRAITSVAAHVSDFVEDARTKRQLVSEVAKARDVLLYASNAPVLEEVATVSDSTTHRTRALLSEAATAQDAVLQKRTTGQLVADTARAVDVLVWRVPELFSDALAVDELWFGRLHAAVVVDEVAAASDYVLDAYLAKVVVLAATGRASDQTFDRLLARQFVTDVAAAEDEVLQSGAAGQAWTAHKGGWAISRWAPLDFTGLVVIDGVLYGTNAQGVFALDGQAETMTAEIRTGLLDVGGDITVRLDGSYLEYRLDGTAQLDVTQTQQGVRQTYTYDLPAKPAAEMTSNRFVLGRGLRSRHYEFTLRLQGTRGHINDWRVMTAPSTRRL